MSSHYTRRPAGRCLLPLFSLLVLISAVEAAQQGNVASLTGANATSSQLLVLPASSTYPIWNVTGLFLLQHTTIKDWSSLRPSKAQADGAFGRLLALPWMLMSGGTITFFDVNISTSCQTLDILQHAACTSLSLEQLANLEVTPGRLVVLSWQDSHISAQNLTFTCNDNRFTPDTADAVPTAPFPVAMARCAVVHVSEWSELANQSRVLQAWANSTTIVLDKNITVAALTAQQADQHVDVYRQMQVISAGQPGSLLYMNLGFTHGEGLWEIISKNASILFQGITFLTLPLGPQEKFPMSVLPWGMWNVRMERCHVNSTPVVLRNCVLITNAETMDYASHWASEFLSVFPDRQQAAHWYGEDPTCTPMQKRSLLGQQWWPQLKLQDQHTWVARNATSLAVELINTTLTSQKPAGLDFVSSGLQLTKLFEQDPYLPFPEITWVTDAPSFVTAFKEQSTTYIAVLGNISVDATLWDAEPIELRRDLVLAGWANKPTVIDWQGAVKVMQLHKHTVKMRNLVLMNGGQGGPDAVPTWACNLTLYQWPLMYDWAESSLQLQNVNIIVPQSEYNILYTLNKRARDHFDPASSGIQVGSSRADQLARLAWTQTANFSDRQCIVPLLVESGIVGVQTVVSNTPLAFPLLPKDVVLASYPSFATPPPMSPTSHHGADVIHHSTWKLVLIIVLPLSACATALLAGALWTVRHRRKQLLAKASERCTSGDKPLLGAGNDCWDNGAAGAMLGSSRGPSHASNGLLTACHTITFSQQAMAASGVPSIHSSQGSPARDHLSIHVHSPAASLHHGASCDAAAFSRSRPISHTSDHSHSPPHPACGGQYISHGPTHGPYGDKSAPQCVHGSSTPPQSQPGVQGEPSAGEAGPATPPQPHLTLPQWLEQGGPELISSIMDSFDVPPSDPGALLINKLNMSSDHHTPAISSRMSGEHDVVSQLKGFVSRMQEEVGEQEVHITRVLGQGGGGVVYQGVWRGLTVAVKSLVFTSLPDRPISRHQQRAMTEAAICRTLHHPNIVATYSYDLQALQSVRPLASNKSHDTPQHTSSRSGSHASGNPVLPPEPGPVHEYKLQIIQEYCDGGTLKSLIDSDRLHTRPIQEQTGPEAEQAQPDPDLAAVLQLAIDMATGMAHVHSRNIVHGDLTPANVLLRTDNNSVSNYIAKISDFGLSWKLARGQEHVSNARQGTTCYIPPEVLHVGIMSRAADVWSFGMILHEMWHGTPSWRKRHRLCTDPAVVAANMPWSGADQLSWSPSCPPTLRTLITSCLLPDPAARPSFTSVIGKLRAIQSRASQLMTPDSDMVNDMLGVMPPNGDVGGGPRNSPGQMLLAAAQKANAGGAVGSSPPAPSSCPGQVFRPLTAISSMAGYTAIRECSSVPLDLGAVQDRQSSAVAWVPTGPCAPGSRPVDQPGAAGSVILESPPGEGAVPLIMGCPPDSKGYQPINSECRYASDCSSAEHVGSRPDVTVGNGASMTLQETPCSCQEDFELHLVDVAQPVWDVSSPLATHPPTDVGVNANNWFQATLLQAPSIGAGNGMAVYPASEPVPPAGQVEVGSSSGQEVLCCTFKEFADVAASTMQERGSQER